MKKLLLLPTVFFLLVFILSSSSSFMRAWTQYRASEASGMVPDKFLYGDLYSLSWLPTHRFPAFHAKDLIPYFIKNRQPSTVRLYSICDSYLYSFTQDNSLLAHADDYRFAKWNIEGQVFRLDPSKRNILLLEIVERNARWSLADTTSIYRHLEVVPSLAQERTTGLTPITGQNNIFNPNLEQNLDFTLFEYQFFTILKEFKAALNLRLFNRKSPDVFVSPKLNQLYLQETVDTLNTTSSFKPITATELDALVASLNAVYRHYRRAGFHQVYLMIAPNPVTILEPDLGIYNRLIPRLQTHPALLMPTINVFNKLRQLRHEPIYLRSDTHWDKAGFLAGIAQIDSALATQAH